MQLVQLLLNSITGCDGDMSEPTKCYGCGKVHVLWCDTTPRPTPELDVLDHMREVDSLTDPPTRNDLLQDMREKKREIVTLKIQVEKLVATLAEDARRKKLLGITL